jgi:hypothetical protein
LAASGLGLVWPAADWHASAIPKPIAVSQNFRVIPFSVSVAPPLYIYPRRGDSRILFLPLARQVTLL